jgi:hypothetical protein
LKYVDTGSEGLILVKSAENATDNKGSINVGQAEESNKVAAPALTEEHGAHPSSSIVKLESSSSLKSSFAANGKRLSFLFEERETARRFSGFGVATAWQPNPIALWILGPSAVGKSTQAKTRAKDFGIPFKDGVPDAVLIDGEFFRDAHQSYREWAQTDDWKAAYPALKSRINKEKMTMLQDAKNQRVHLIIPQTCSDIASCLYEVKNLTDAGYMSHVIAIQAPKEEVGRRGMLRAQADGKVYDPSHFERSVAALDPIIEASNGRFVHLFVSERPGPPNACFDVRVTSEGWCGKATRVRVADGHAATRAQALAPY